MVRLLHDRGGGAAGKLSGDPAVETAAVALLLGFSDPLGLLALEREDYNLAVAVVQKARDMEREQTRNLAEYTAGHVAKALIPGLSKTIMSALARALR